MSIFKGSVFFFFFLHLFKKRKYENYKHKKVSIKKVSAFQYLFKYKLRLYVCMSLWL